MRLIDETEVINGIKELLESPYVHSQCGEVSNSAGYLVRKEMAEIIIDLCVKKAKAAYDVDKVVEQMDANCWKDIDNIDLPGIDLDKAIELVKAGGKE